jgi:hypothetical protein
VHSIVWSFISHKKSDTLPADIVAATHTMYYYHLLSKLIPHSGFGIFLGDLDSFFGKCGP